jgi:hypothetical protein
MKVVAPLKKNEKNPLLLSLIFINRFEGSCGTFGGELKNPIVVNDIKLVCPKKNNDHGVDVSTIIII